MGGFEKNRGGGMVGRKVQKNEPWGGQSGGQEKRDRHGGEGGVGVSGSEDPKKGWKKRGGSKGRSVRNALKQNGERLRGKKKECHRRSWNLKKNAKVNLAKQDLLGATDAEEKQRAEEGGIPKEL